MNQPQHVSLSRIGLGVALLASCVLLVPTAAARSAGPRRIGTVNRQLGLR